MNRCYGYIRVSQDPKHEKLSPEIQRQLIERYAHKERLQLVEVFGDVDVPSAKIEFAGTWQKLYDSLAKGELIITNDVTRLGRDLYETLTRVRAVDKLNVEVISLEGAIDRDRAAGKFMFHVLLATGQFINDQLSERLQAMHSFKAQRGEWPCAHAPLGYDYVSEKKTLEINEDEAAVVREIFTLRDQGITKTTITRDLAARGIRGKRGRMNMSSVSQTLHNQAYIGKRVHKGTVYEGLHEAIIDTDLWDRVQARERANTKSLSLGRYLLSGLVVCGDCGSHMVHWSRNHSGQNRRLLHCKEAHDFPGKGKKLVSIEAHLVEGWVVERLFARVNARNVERLKARIQKQQPKRESRAEQLRRQLAQVESSLDRLVSDYYDHDEPMLSPDQFREKNTELHGRRTGIAAELQLLEDEAKLDNVVYLDRARDLKTSWEGLSLDERREALRLYIDRVVVYPRPTPGPKINPDRVEIVWK
ncbi:MAG: recombinase family protein [Candidatus Geothermincolia bacterium]